LSFQKITDAIDQFVKIKPWLQFVGLMIVFGGLVFLTDYAHAAKLAAYVGASLSATGFAYDLIYP